MHKSFSFLLGFVIGAAVGWMLGMLYAPSAGEETRASLSSKAVELRSRAEQLASEVAHEVDARVRHMAEGDLELDPGVSV
ncbi:MAG: YtxH domain-containing protein [Anaerolineae bacterium]|nr:YtxH domain-containing protein [Anaerolineae bacterium]